MNPASPEGTDRVAAGNDTEAASTSAHWQSWVTADNAAGFVLRYLHPMREELIERLGSAPLADESLKLLIGHLVSQGFGSHAKGRMRDFLMRAIRAAAKTALAQSPTDPQPPEASKPHTGPQPHAVLQSLADLEAFAGTEAADERPAEVDFSAWTVDAPSWLARWRAALLARAWRSLERLEHKQVRGPLYSILHIASAHPRETAQMLAVRINTETDLQVDPATIKNLLPQARAEFAQLLLTEVRETLHQSDPESVQSELQAIGLAGLVRKLGG